ncbi:gametocyte-specific factor 1-like [Dendronephthya gigantea]|uniref:gametocyte-specific factor 1-like n=1 Tax=Dendronephthya gigantea TaxID=151771 RepID=UPI00106C24F7|nr:gametocyte-specific factor 1-like [Dendronephthya gigantea]
MAWTTSSEWERWDPEQHVICPYDASHRITAARFQRHLVKCRKNYPNKDFVSCPFNATHQILRPHLRSHICQCPDKNVVEASMSECYKDVETLDKLKGNTSVPPYNNPGLNDVGDEDWDREIAEDQQIFYEVASGVQNSWGSNKPTQFEQRSLMGLNRQALKRQVKQKALEEQGNQRWT